MGLIRGISMWIDGFDIFSSKSISREGLADILNGAKGMATFTSYDVVGTNYTEFIARVDALKWFNKLKNYRTPPIDASQLMRLVNEELDGRDMLAVHSVYSNENHLVVPRYGIDILGGQADYNFAGIQIPRLMPIVAEGPSEIRVPLQVRHIIDMVYGRTELGHAVLKEPFGAAKIEFEVRIE
jgi:hypothetical protein